MALMQRLGAALEQSGDQPAFLTQDDQTLSALKLRATIWALADSLAAQGVRPGDRVCPIVDNRDLRLFLLLACVLTRADGIAVPDLSPLRLAGIEPDWIVAFADQPVDHPRVLRFDPAWLAPSARAPAAPGGGRLIHASSGTTGQAKYMALSDAVLDRRIARVSAMVTPAGGARLITVPLTGSFGMAYLLPALLAGDPVLGARETVAGTLRAARDFAAVEAVVTPALLDDIVSARMQGVPGPAFRRVLLGGAVADPAILQRARRVWPDLVLGLSIGASETGFFGYGTVDPGSVETGWAGYPSPEVEVALWPDPAADGFAPGAGRLALRVPAAARVEGYLGGAPVYDAEGWFETGDIVRRADDGALVVLGRSDHLVNLGGAKVAAELIEALVSTVPGVAQVAAVPVGPERGLGLLVVAGPGFDAAVIDHHLRRHLNTTAPIRVRTAPALPRLASGKTDRQAIARLLAQPG